MAQQKASRKNAPYRGDTANKGRVAPAYKGAFNRWDSWTCMEQLPRAVRDELNYGAFGNWSPQQLLEHIMVKGLTDEQVLAEVRRANAQAEVREAEKTWGRDHKTLAPIQRTASSLAELGL